MALWLVFRVTIEGSSRRRLWLAPLLILAIVFGLVVSAYIGPVLQRYGVSDATITEIRARDLPFWFGLMSLGTLVGIFAAPTIFRDLRFLLLAATVLAYCGYALVRASRITYVGELGWELYVPTEFMAGVYDELIEAGAGHGLVHAGCHALNSPRAP